jgi:hypothetical protein
VAAGERNWPGLSLCPEKDMCAGLEPKSGQESHCFCGIEASDILSEIG